MEALSERGGHHEDTCSAFLGLLDAHNVVDSEQTLKFGRILGSVYFQEISAVASAQYSYKSRVHFNRLLV